MHSRTSQQFLSFYSTNFDTRDLIHVMHYNTWHLCKFMGKKEYNLTQRIVDLLEILKIVFGLFRFLEFIIIIIIIIIIIYLFFFFSNLCQQSVCDING